jgi:hypothetical protein
MLFGDVPRREKETRDEHERREIKVLRTDAIEKLRERMGRKKSHPDTTGSEYELLNIIEDLLEVVDDLVER